MTPQERLDDDTIILKRSELEGLKKQTNTRDIDVVLQEEIRNRTIDEIIEMGSK